MNYINAMSKMPMSVYFKDWSMWEKMWLGVSTVAIMLASILTWDTSTTMGSVIATVSSVSGIWCVVLVAKKRVSNYLWGVINAIAYAYMAYTWKLYGEVMLNALFFLPMQIIGYKMWLGNRVNVDEVKVKFLGNLEKIAVAMLTILIVSMYGFFLKYLGGTTPYLDSMSTVLSVVAMILMALRYREQWLLWIIVDVVTVIMWSNIVFLQGGLFNIGILIMWISFLINAVYGYYSWRK